MEFDAWGLTIHHLPSRAVLARCDSSGPLYSLDLTSTPPTSVASSYALATTTTSVVWHCRLGHPGLDVMSSFPAAQTSPIPRAPLRLCHACQLGRHSCLPFSTSTSRVVQAFDLVHCDLWTSPVLSLSGYKYYLVILDDYSHFLWTFPLRLKSDTFTTLTQFFAWVSTMGPHVQDCVRKNGATKVVSSSSPQEDMW
jgi:hypothetical protein